MAGSLITLTEGSTMTANFRRKFPHETKAVFYTLDIYTSLLSQEGCVGIRIYNALDVDGNMTNVMVGVDEQGNDLYEGKVYNRGIMCPHVCPSSNPLNS